MWKAGQRHSSWRYLPFTPRTTNSWVWKGLIIIMYMDEWNLWVMSKSSGRNVSKQLFLKAFALLGFKCSLSFFLTPSGQFSSLEEFDCNPWGSRLEDEVGWREAHCRQKAFPFRTTSLNRLCMSIPAPHIPSNSKRWWEVRGFLWKDIQFLYLRISAFSGSPCKCGILIIAQLFSNSWGLYFEILATHDVELAVFEAGKADQAISLQQVILINASWLSSP